MNKDTAYNNEIENTKFYFHNKRHPFVKVEEKVGYKLDHVNLMLCI